MTTTQPDIPSLGAERPPNAAPIERCVSCGAELATPFCPVCGEKRASDRRYTLLHFAQEAIEHIAQLDGTFWRSVKTLVAKPGELTAAYMRGERLRYMKPLQLFVVVSIAYFVVSFATHVRTFDTPLRFQVAQATKPARMVEQRLAERHTTMAQYAELFDHTSTTQAKTLVIVMVPAFALLVAAVEFRKRRYALQHVVFALHTYTALLLILMAVDLLALHPLLTLLQQAARLLRTNADSVFSLVTLGGMFAYLLPALVRAYGDRRPIAIMKTVILLAGMVFILLAYRLLLFYTTFWAT